MKLTRAAEIIESLSDGIDPYTGEAYSQESPYQRPDSVRALITALIVLRQEEAKEQRRRNLPRKAGQPWLDDEDLELVKNFDQGKTIKELGQLHQRTIAAIEARLIKLGRLKERA